MQKIITTYILLLFAFSLAAQTGDLTFHWLNQSTGLSELTNAYISENTEGVVWLSSNDGLNRYDGKNMSVFLSNLDKDKNTTIVTSKIFEDNQKNSWFSTVYALHCLSYTQQNVQSQALKSGKYSDIHAFHFDKTTQNLWLKADSFLVLFNTFTQAEKVCGKLPANAVRSYPIFDASGRVKAVASSFFYSGFSISYLTDNAISHDETFFKGKEWGAMADLPIYNIHIESDTVIWLPSSRGLIRFNPTNKTYRVFNTFSERLSQNLRLKTLTDVAAFQNRYLWVSSVSNGLLLFDKQQERFVRQDTTAWLGNRLMNINRINNIYVDKNDNLWLSIWEKGVLHTHIKKSKFNSYLKPENYKDNRITTAIVEDKNQNLWCAVPEVGVFQLDKTGKLLHTIERSRLNEKIGSLFCDNQQRIWLLGSQNIYLLNPASRTLKKINTSDVHGYNKMVQISDNQFLVLSLFELMSFTVQNDQFVQKTMMSLNSGHYLFCDKSKRIFINSENSLSVYAFEKNNFTLLKRIEGVGYINGVTNHPTSDTMWLASSKGLLCLNLQKINYEVVNDSQRELSKAFNHILQDKNGILWLSSNAGLFKYQPATGSVKQYTESDGLQSMQFLPNSGVALRDGTLAFGGVNGINIFDPNTVRNLTFEPAIQIATLKINDVKRFEGHVNAFKNLVFTHDSNTLTFSFVAVDYSDPAKNRYKYFLSGYDKDTVDANTEGVARYANLPAGDYVFNVWATNSDGVWAKNPKQLAIKILPPWYQTWQFRLFLTLLAMGIVYAYYRNRINQIKKAEAEKRKEAEFKQKEAEYKQLIAETETAVLRLQMNPHFIFNSLNSINSYMHQKDMDTASDYLTRFAKLMRTILILSETPFIPIENEIQFLESYLKTEAMRFEKSFSYKINVDDDIDPDEMRVPTMLLQPFVENAIWHGLSNKSDEGLVQISFYLENERLICSVQDNGSGRVQKKHDPNHVSKALSITEKRLKYLMPDSDSKLLEIFDLKDPQGNALGTKVCVYLPPTL
ncbi:MAG: histidine kinase [Saprospiraceae bacterium]|nr:histidine kinase [Saprospiraceae bacterium]